MKRRKNIKGKTHITNLKTRKKIIICSKTWNDRYMKMSGMERIGSLLLKEKIN